MKKIQLIAFIALLVAGIQSISYAQTSTSAAHGGVVQKSGTHTIEMVTKSNEIMFYVMDANQKPIANKGCSGTVTFQFADNTSSKSTLSALGEDGFSAKNNQINKFTSCVVKLKVNKKNVTATFKNTETPVKKEKPHGHSHGEDGHHHH